MTKPYAPVVASADRLPNMAGLLLHPLHPAYLPLKWQPAPGGWQPIKYKTKRFK